MGEFTDKAKAVVTGSKKPEPDAVPKAVAVSEAANPVTSKANGNTKGGGSLVVGEKIELEGFGGTVQTHDGTDVTVKELVDKSGAGIVIFTYPKASTPGCKSQILESFL